jgi:hypothetical protein
MLPFLDAARRVAPTLLNAHSLDTHATGLRFLSLLGLPGTSNDTELEELKKRLQFVLSLLCSLLQFVLSCSLFACSLFSVCYVCSQFVMYVLSLLCLFSVYRRLGAPA